MSQISAPISFGELIDKITILEIKSQRINDPVKLANVLHELEVLEQVWGQSPQAAVDIAAERDQLKAINEALWDIEDDIRNQERLGKFGSVFIELARAVYVTNDRRAEVKRRINVLLGSDLIEEKSYQDYKSG